MTNREIAELIAKFRTPPGMSWEPLADDIETVLDTKDRGTERELKAAEMSAAIASAKSH